MGKSFTPHEDWNPDRDPDREKDVSNEELARMLQRHHAVMMHKHHDIMCLRTKVVTAIFIYLFLSLVSFSVYFFLVGRHLDRIEQNQQQNQQPKPTENAK